MTGTLILLRHGESEWNAKNLFTGWVDVPLSEEGVLRWADEYHRRTGGWPSATLSTPSSAPDSTSQMRAPAPRSTTARPPAPIAGLDDQGGAPVIPFGNSTGHN